MVTFYRAFDFSGARDGVVFQYSLDNGITWNVLGSNVPGNDLSTGIEWYNTSGIVAGPGGSANTGLVGWSSSDVAPGQWVQSRHKLDEIPVEERDAVLFRFALAADAADQSEGFAIDDFFVGERPQTVLLEQFSGAVGNNASIGDAQEAIDELLDVTTVVDPNPGNTNPDLLNANDATLITYKTDLNGANRVNTSNPSDPNARVVFYGVETLPTILINGAEGQETSNLTSFSNNKFNQEALLEPDITMGINLPTAADDQVAVEVSMSLNGTTLPDNNADLNIRLYIAIVEKTVEDDGMMFRNVMRKLLPDGAGLPLVSDGTTIESVSQTWSIQRVDDPDNLAVVAFIQDNTTKRVIQAATVDVGDKADVVVTGIGPEILESTEVTIYPNPAHEQVVVNFGAELEEDFDWVLYNQAGMNVNFGEVQRGSEEFSIGTLNMPSGLYFLRVGNDNKRFKHFKLLIEH